jgi:hypothetical protein
MSTTAPLDLETDPRFPSGKWTGFFLQRVFPGRHRMELLINFHGGTLSGEGRDWVGDFVLRGQYDLADGTCRWNKAYLGKHDVNYLGYNEGKGIWGTWEIPTVHDPEFKTGGFHIWPEGMADPSQPALHEEVEPPLVVTELDDLVESGIAIPG